eukprot:TRINITY_DN5146_c0_g1_i1.p1 TRINITY_DN5146_c0_g1~~TRINITY_DN5146_c0_g1_i1.p1  ORF type:complete len:1067 (+),score=245.89 TRINITY_DN5146_c0_g1_i1:171-3371(+)
MNRNTADTNRIKELRASLQSLDNNIKQQTHKRIQLLKRLDKRNETRKRLSHDSRLSDICQQRAAHEFIVHSKISDLQARERQIELELAVLNDDFKLAPIPIPRSKLKTNVISKEKLFEGYSLPSINQIASENSEGKRVNIAAKHNSRMEALRKGFSNRMREIHERKKEILSENENVEVPRNLPLLDSNEKRSKSARETTNKEYLKLEKEKLKEARQKQDDRKKTVQSYRAKQISRLSFSTKDRSLTVFIQGFILSLAKNAVKESEENMEKYRLEKEFAERRLKQLDYQLMLSKQEIITQNIANTILDDCMQEILSNLCETLCLEHKKFLQDSFDPNKPVESEPVSLSMKSSEWMHQRNIHRLGAERQFWRRATIDPVVVDGWKKRKWGNATHVTFPRKPRERVFYVGTKKGVVVSFNLTRVVNIRGVPNIYPMKVSNSVVQSPCIDVDVTTNYDIGATYECGEAAIYRFEKDIPEDPNAKKKKQTEKSIPAYKHISQILPESMRTDDETQKRLFGVSISEFIPQSAPSNKIPSNPYEVDYPFTLMGTKGGLMVAYRWKTIERTNWDSIETEETNLETKREPRQYWESDVWEDGRPFPSAVESKATTNLVMYRGHTAEVISIKSTDPMGQRAVSIDKNGTICFWNISYNCYRFFRGVSWLVPQRAITLELSPQTPSADSEFSRTKVFPSNDLANLSATDHLQKALEYKKTLRDKFIREFPQVFHMNKLSNGNREFYLTSQHEPSIFHIVELSPIGHLVGHSTIPLKTTTTVENIVGISFSRHCKEMWLMLEEPPVDPKPRQYVCICVDLERKVVKPNRIKIDSFGAWTSDLHPVFTHSPPLEALHTDFLVVAYANRICVFSTESGRAVLGPVDLPPLTKKGKALEQIESIEVSPALDYIAIIDTREGLRLFRLGMALQERERFRFATYFLSNSRFRPKDEMVTLPTKLKFSKLHIAQQMLKRIISEAVDESLKKNFNYFGNEEPTEEQQSSGFTDNTFHTLLQMHLPPPASSHTPVTEDLNSDSFNNTTSADGASVVQSSHHSKSNEIPELFPQPSFRSMGSLGTIL